MAGTIALTNLLHMPTRRPNAARVNPLPPLDNENLKSTLELIAENKASQAPNLDLWNQHKEYTDLPKELFELTHLKKLSIMDFPITRIPSQFYKFASLERLEIYESNIKHFPIELSQLPNLDQLTFRSTELNIVPSKIEN